MIHHASIGVRNPDMTAAVLSELLDGSVFRLANHLPAMSVQMKDGSMIELWPQETRFTSDHNSQHVSVEKATKEVLPSSSFHLFLSTPRTESEILAIARRAGWEAYVRQPTQPFPLIEVWVEGHTMLEICPEEWLPRYNSVITERTKSLHSSGHELG